ncbi:hypothetical protein JL721_1086 [Aureococcus anophagefferens]|nr:hypothetical protein JL721_1086 [Aureococcus anophagefferens]
MQRKSSAPADGAALPSADPRRRRRRPQALRRVLRWSAYAVVACLAARGAADLFASERPDADAGPQLRGGGPAPRLRPPRRQRRSAPLGDAGGLRRLVVVAGHAVTMAESLEGVEENDASWYLLGYQRGRDLPREFVKHARRGAELAAGRDDALLVFSGGQTRRDAGPRSEAQSYWLLAEHFGWWGLPGVAARATTEEYARDSYENLLFSICRFREVAGDYPEAVDVVSFDFKERRFVDLHAPAIRFPKDAFHFEAVPVDGASRFDGAAAAEGEAAAAAAFEEDPYGCDGELHAKRRSRDPFHRGVPYGTVCPELGGLLAHCGDRLYQEALPWTGDRGVPQFARGPPPKMLRPRGPPPPRRHHRT